MKVDLPAKDGDTALIIASANGDTQVVEWLLGHNASVNLPNTQERTALIRACRKNRHTVSKEGGRADTDREFRRQEQMLARGASRLLQPKKAASIAHWHRDCEATKLAVALKKVVVLLLGKGARVDVQDKDGATALMWQARTATRKW